MIFSQQRPTSQCIGSPGVNARLRTLVWGSPYQPSSLSRPVRFLVRLWYESRCEGRSFLGRMKTRLEGPPRVAILGPMWERTAEGHRIPNRRTDCRSRGIEKLIADHPWVGTTDRELWLLGFDAGEQLGAYNRDRQEGEDREDVEIQTHP
jgi:hypothetical protein